MNKILLSIAFISVFFTGALAQESKIENTQLQLDGDNLIITYDVTGSSALDNVWLDIKTTSNKAITATTLSGDIGKSISVGKKKKIIWNMKADGIDLQGEELNVKVLATKPNVSTNTLTDIAEVIRGKQSNSRDKIIYKNGTSLTGKLDQRFVSSNLKFISTDGNTLTINPSEIEKIKNNSTNKDSVYLKNGDIVYGTITEIYPNNKITLQSKKNDKYSIQCADINSINTYSSNSGNYGRSYIVMPLIQFFYGFGLKLGVLDNWGYNAQIIHNGSFGKIGIGVSKYIYSTTNIDIHADIDANYGSYWNNWYTSNYIFESLGADISFIGQYRHLVFNVGVGLPLNFTIGIGYSISAK